ncbi:MAG: type I restriction enzyme HsdR N-terminal domain-containing protein, partial [Lachnospira sp.]
MVIENLLKHVELPAIYKREGKDCYYDTYRKKLIEITPEETIRQKVAALFEYQYGVPKDVILLEVPMSYYVEGASGRADIVIHMYDEEEQCLYPVTVIECKNEKVFLTD